MKSQTHVLKNGRRLTVREATEADARALMAYLDIVCAESDFLSFGPGEFEMTEQKQALQLRQCREAENQLYILALLDDEIVSAVHISAAKRPRIRHNGELAITVRKSCWHMGIGSLMMDVMIRWATASPLITKINLRVREDNPHAIRLYRQKGFVLEGTIKRDILVDGRYYACHWMGLEL